MSNHIPEHIMAAASALLAPYGVNLAELLNDTGGGHRQKYMTARQASDYCGLAAKTLRDKALAGEIKSHRLGNTSKSRVLIERAALDEWINRQ